MNILSNIVNEINDRYRSDPNFDDVYTRYFDNARSPDGTIGVDFSVLDGYDADITLALGRADIVFDSVEVTTLDHGNWIEVTEIRVSGKSDDLYDFNYNDTSLTGGLTVRQAATLEYGLSANYGRAGRIYWNEIYFDQSYITTNCNLELFEDCVFSKP